MFHQFKQFPYILIEINQGKEGTDKFQCHFNLHEFEELTDITLQMRQKKLTSNKKYPWKSRLPRARANVRACHVIELGCVTGPGPRCT